MFSQGLEETQHLSKYYITFASEAVYEQKRQEVLVLRNHRIYWSIISHIMKQKAGQCLFFTTSPFILLWRLCHPDTVQSPATTTGKCQGQFISSQNGWDWKHKTKQSNTNNKRTQKDKRWRGYGERGTLLVGVWTGVASMEISSSKSHEQICHMIQLHPSWAFSQRTLYLTAEVPAHLCSLLLYSLWPRNGNNLGVYQWVNG